MFGYVRIRKDDLKVKDYYIYKQKYCGLCATLGKNYGFIYRMFISYDITFLILDEGNLVKKLLLKLFKHNSKYISMLNLYGERITTLSKLMKNQMQVLTCYLMLLVNFSLRFSNYFLIFIKKKY